MTAAATPYRFGPTEQPTFPGSPYAPEHRGGRRLGYLIVALVVGVAATLGNALVSVNLPNLAGSLGLYTAEATWLTSTYVAINATANLLLIRARIRFGIRWVTNILLMTYAAASLAQLANPGFTAALLTRAASGALATALVTITVYNLLQVFTPKARPLALLLGVTIPQFGVPLARMFPLEMLALGQWQGLHLLELATALTALAAMAILPLPPSITEKKVFERLDFLTIGLAMPAMLLLCGALGAGRFLWWTETSWIGWALASSALLFSLVVAIEHGRKSPLLHVGWIGSRDILRFAAVAVLMRFALAEQTYGAIGLFSASGLTSDQLHGLFLIVLVAMALGMIAAAATLTPERIPVQVLAASLIIALGAWLDSGSNNLTRPEQLYLSQALLGFGACLFIGPALLYGFIRVLQLGPDYLVSYLVVFSITQNIGGLLGSALLGTYQVARARAHASSLSEHIIASDPLVADRLVQQGAAGLFASLQREAAVLAFNDVFRLVALLSAATAAYIFFLILRRRLAERRQISRS
jgi:hypothetical protein